MKTHPTDMDVLKVLADCRLATADQIALLTDRNVAALRRRIKVLISHNMIQVVCQTAVHDSGRPVQVFVHENPSGTHCSILYVCFCVA